ncbi:hypothetical protein VNO78_10342 [Psophocarpus tetragonolobus]|uniref:WRKY domain-containing protein n=1 Tax=Psophocarpus tetragonolobus TaxID=3891 RepID=A0AAN9SKG0_PSOTE
MDEFACMRDWDFEAIVRGSSSGEGSDPHQFSYFFSQQDDLLDSFPEFSETTRVLDDLEDLYKPFYPHTLTLPLPIPMEMEPQQSEDKVMGTGGAVQVQVPAPASNKCKKSKKRQNKSVVKQVTTAEGVDDAWAWRKYGQKPIKGSPYPRSYYRCSSSKGCLARKQVERSHKDPSLFLITYTAEHTHPHPTRRNSLAGTTRKNNSLLPPPTTTTTTTTTPHSSSLPIQDDDPFLHSFDAWIPTSDQLIELDSQHFAFPLP